MRLIDQESYVFPRILLNLSHDFALSTLLYMEIFGRKIMKCWCIFLSKHIDEIQEEVIEFQKK